MNKIKETEKAYFAGIFDGEGYIGISKSKGKQNFKYNSVYKSKFNPNRIYFIQVPSTMKTARKAVSWSFGMKEEEYRPLLQT